MNRVHKALVAYLEDRTAAGDEIAGRLLVRLRAAAPRNRIASLAKARKEKVAQERALIGHMRSEVWERNLRGSRNWAGACDACRLHFRHLAEGGLDHWISRAQGGDDHPDNGWRLCPACHQAKTDNRPSREFWNQRREVYCLATGIPFVERRIREDLGGHTP